MGASTFYEEAVGRTLQEAFSNAVSQAQYESGHGGYTGTIAEKQSVVEIPLPKGRDPYEYASELIDDGRVSDKWGPAGAILMTETEYIEQVPYKTKEAFRHVQKGKREWVTSYDVYGKKINSWTAPEELLGSYASQTEAEREAKRLAVHYNSPVSINISKRLKRGESKIVTFEPVQKGVKHKKGRKKYLFFGWASS